jgi:hypothetical protein
LAGVDDRGGAVPDLAATNAPGSPSASWLLLPEGHLPTIRRAVGGLLLCILPEVWFWSHGGPGPYHVPAGRIGGSPIDLPLPPPWLDATLWVLYAAAALAMLSGLKGRAVPAVAAAILAYYGWRDARACNSSYVQLLFTYLVALLFAREPVNAARRLIQCSLTACYAFSVIQKLAMPEWRLGYTLLDLLRHCDGVRAAWVPLLRMVAPPPGLAWVLASGVIGVEAFIAGGLWWRRTRSAAMGLGILLHVGFAAVLPGTEIFAPVMLVGYLAFLDAGPPPGPGARTRRSETILALACLAALLAIPARLYLPPMRPWHLLAHMDHLPWTYSMFSQIDRVDSVDVSYLDRGGSRRAVEPVGRMLEATSDEEVRALARDVLRVHPEAEAVEVRVRLTINHRRGLVKLLTIERGRPPTLIVRQGR